MLVETARRSIWERLSKENMVHRQSVINIINCDCRSPTVKLFHGWCVKYLCLAQGDTFSTRALCDIASKHLTNEHFFFVNEKVEIKTEVLLTTAIKVNGNKTRASNIWRSYSQFKAALFP